MKIRDELDKVVIELTPGEFIILQRAFNYAYPLLSEIYPTICQKMLEEFDRW